MLDLLSRRRLLVIGSALLLPLATCAVLGCAATSRGGPMGTWSAKQLDAVEAAAELEISTLRRNGEWRGFTPIWVVRSGDEVFVRSWHRRTTGWYGDAVAVGQARVRLPGVEAAVTVVDLGEEARENDDVDAAYRVKYGGGGTVSGMVTDDARATTLRLDQR